MGEDGQGRGLVQQLRFVQVCRVGPELRLGRRRRKAEYLYDRPLIIGDWPARSVLRNNYAARRSVGTHLTVRVRPSDASLGARNSSLPRIISLASSSSFRIRKNGHPISIHSVSMFLVAECGKISRPVRCVSDTFVVCNMCQV